MQDRQTSLRANERCGDQTLLVPGAERPRLSHPFFRPSGELTD